MIKLIDILKEAKQVGTLYHVMDVDKFSYLLSNDTLAKPTSFTRNKNYDIVIGREKEYTYQIVVDGDMLSNRYKIRPIDQGKGWVSDEYEELVEKNITNAGKYITQIIVIAKKRYDWKEKGYSKTTYNPWQGMMPVEMSAKLANYLEKYPQIQIKIKDGHRGRIHDLTDTDMKWLRSMGIVNPKEKEISETVEGVYRNRKRLTKAVDRKTVSEYIRANQSQFYTTTEDGKTIPISKMDQEEPYWDSEFVEDPDFFLTNDANQCVVIKQQRDTNNRIYIQILYGDTTEWDLEYYRKLVAKTGKSVKTINVYDSYKDMGQAAE